MRILGIDPGYAIVGYGVIDSFPNRSCFLGCGVVETSPKAELPERLENMFDSICDIIERYKPDTCGIESLYFQNNQKTAIKVAEGRGAILLGLRKKMIPISEYTPLQVKSFVTGYGKAQKSQVIMMTKMLLNLKEAPKPDDAADALAVALCHASCSRSLVRK